jgi:hypothetical protein
MQDDLPQALLQILALPLTKLLRPLSGDDKNAAWDNAIAATSSFSPGNANEFRLAVRIAILNIQANELAVEASAPGLPPALSIRMRQCALSYIREADKAERRLEKLQTVPIKEPKQPMIQPQETICEAPAIPAEEPSPSAAGTPVHDATPEPHAAASAAPAATSIPAWKQKKLQRRLTKRLAREARMQAQALVQAAYVPLAA